MARHHVQHPPDTAGRAVRADPGAGEARRGDRPPCDADHGRGGEAARRADLHRCPALFDRGIPDRALRRRTAYAAGSERPPRRRETRSSTISTRRRASSRSRSPTCSAAYAQAAHGRAGHPPSASRHPRRAPRAGRTRKASLHRHRRRRPGSVTSIATSGSSAAIAANDPRHVFAQMSAATEEERHDPDRPGAPIGKPPNGLREARRQVVEIGELDREIGRLGAHPLRRRAGKVRPTVGRGRRGRAGRSQVSPIDVMGASGTASIPTYSCRAPRTYRFILFHYINRDIRWSLDYMGAMLRVPLRQFDSKLVDAAGRAVPRPDAALPARRADRGRVSPAAPAKTASTSRSTRRCCGSRFPTASSPRRSFACSPALPASMTEATAISRRGRTSSSTGRASKTCPIFSRSSPPSRCTRSRPAAIASATRRPTRSREWPPTRSSILGRGPS